MAKAIMTVQHAGAQGVKLYATAVPRLKISREKTSTSKAENSSNVPS